MTKCNGCEEEMMECYEWQSKGYDAGLDWSETFELEGSHCFVFVLDKKGEFIII